MRIGFALAILFVLAGCDSPPAPIADPGVRLVLEKRLQGGSLPARELGFGRGGLLAMSWADGRVIVTQTSPAEGDQRGVVARHEGGATCVAFSPDARLLATGGYDGKIRIWSLPDMRLLRTIAASPATLWSLSFSSDGARIASGGEDKIVRIWNVADGRTAAALPAHALNVWKVRFSPDGRWLASASFDREIRLWDARTGRLVRTLAGHGEAVVGLDFSPDGQLMASASDDSTIRLWRPADGALVRTMVAGNHVYSVAFSPDGRRLASSGRARGAVGTFVNGLVGGIDPGDVVRLWRVSDGALLAAARQKDDAMYVAFAPSGDRLATASEDGSVSFWRLAR